MSHTIAECDALLLVERDRLLAAVEAGDMSDEAAAYVELDRLLDERLHLPQQRTP